MGTLSVVRYGTRMALASPFICPVFGFLKTWARDDSKTIVVSQGVPYWSTCRQSPAHSQRCCFLLFWGVAPRLHFRILGGDHIPAARLSAGLPLPPVWLRSGVGPLTFHRSIVSWSLICGSAIMAYSPWPGNFRLTSSPKVLQQTTSGLTFLTVSPLEVGTRTTARAAI